MKEINIIQHQRYFHLVALKGSRAIIKKQFFKDWRINEVERFEFNSGCIITQMSVITDYRYYGGETDYSLGGDNNPPFKYDVILVEYPKIEITILCLPFKNLAKNISFDLESKYNILSNSSFIKVDMEKLININDDYTDYYYNSNHFFFGGIFLSVSGDSYLSTVKLEGDKPLDSEIYKDYFKERINNHECKLEKCIVKCRIEINEDDQAIKAKSSIHIDKYGNYKLYIHTNGKNLITIPVLFEYLSDISCLLDTPYNPVNHINSEE
jgi:hypothetical protein